MGFPTPANVVEDKKNQFFGSTPVLLSTEKQELVVDVLTEERPDFTWEITEHPIEEGLSINDARIQRPTMLTLECTFLDPDLSANGVARQAINGTWSAESWKDKQARLFRMASESDVIKVITPFKTYNSMVIESITPTVTAATGDAFVATVALKEVVRVSSALSETTSDQVPKRLKSKKTEAQKNADKKKPDPKKNGKGMKSVTGKESTGLIDISNTGL